MISHPAKSRVLLAAILASALLAGCGGSDNEGGNDDPPIAAPPAPIASMTPLRVKTFHFAWVDVEGETEYRLLEDPDGRSGYSTVATIAPNSTFSDLVVSLPARINARYVLQACNIGGCSDSAPILVTGSLAEAVGYVKASNTENDDYFGFDVAISSDGITLAVSARRESSNATGINGNQADNSALYSGAVYIFTRSGTTWSQQAYVKASNTRSSGSFGGSVALSADGNTLAVGAPGESSNASGINGDQADTSVPGTGAVYVFTRNGTAWSQQAYVKAAYVSIAATAPPTSGVCYECMRGAFGGDVALSDDGNTLAVGASTESSNTNGINGDQTDRSANFSGAVYLFVRNGTTWTQQAYVKAADSDKDDRFGSSIALAADGNTLAVGAKLEESNATGINGDEAYDGSATYNIGAVYVFIRIGTVWSQQAYLKTPMLGDTWLGSWVALSADGDTLAAAAALDRGNATGINGDPSDQSGEVSGAVYVYTRSGGVWSQQAYVKASNTGAFDSFGSDVALSADGNSLAVGACGEHSNATGINGDQADNSVSGTGAVYVFTRSGTAWSQQAYVKASNKPPPADPGRYAGFCFGGRLALSARGDILAVGASGEDSSAIGINGDQSDRSALDSGAVYLY